MVDTISNGAKINIKIVVRDHIYNFTVLTTFWFEIFNFRVSNTMQDL